MKVDYPSFDAFLSTYFSRMHAAAFGALRSTFRPGSRPACRIVGRIRRPHPRRTFHCSAISYRIPEEDTPGKPETDPISSEASEKDPGEGLREQDIGEQDVVETSTSLTEVESSAVAKKAKQAKSGQGRARLNRQRQPEGVPPVLLPDGFWDKNVKCIGDPSLSGSLTVYGAGSYVEEEFKAQLARQSLALISADLPALKDARYTIHADVFQEILSAVKAGLALRPPRSAKPVPRPITVLQCPKEGATYYLDSVVETIATKLGADLVRLDAQDIAQIVGPYVDENLAWTFSQTSLLGYEAQKVAGRLEDYDKGPPEEAVTEEDEEDVVSTIKKGRSRSSLSNPPEIGKQLASIFDTRFSLPAKNGSAPGPPIIELFGLRGDLNNQPLVKSGEDQWKELKLSTALEALIGAADSKRALAMQENSEILDTEASARDVVVQLKDFKELSGTRQGPELIFALRSVINKRWQEGRNIMLIGTTSTDDVGLSRREIQHLQSDIIDGEKRTILVPPDRREEQETAFDSDEKARIRHINIRHIEDMILKLVDGNQNPPLVVEIEKDLDNAAVYSAGLEEAVWTYARVHRLATTILGHGTTATTIDGNAFTKAWKLLADSDEAKFIWGAAELKREDDEVDFMLEDMKKSSNQLTKEKIKQIRKTCNSHEKRLLGGVILPDGIHTTFNDVHAPKETIEALKTLTSLSLIRPEAFSYGVLATDKIPGLLLYGPPGTGKTLLAKAVAKESGATVLEISGAEVNDMYVGEGEKNVKAIFSLAKKLTPCVVFIDEADAIFAARGESKRTGGTHRELINQFLREWDGMNDLSAFIMVATNRPFDLDEAVLRRLPRRLLVDLPVEKDREAILKIHLKDEVLDESVSLADLAKKTPFYSGSDLKNVSVAAALACIREENEVAAKHTGEEPHVYPEKRILTKQHFEKAIEEISASISEDMSTLAAIRKFDEKYGDRKGRRKKSSGLGFGGTTIEEKDSEAGRVRKVKI